MNPSSSGPSRRDAIKTAGTVAAASVLAGVNVPFVHAAENNTIQLALVGCGGRGTGAAENALLSKQGPTKLIAMADVFQDRLSSSHRALTNEKRPFAKQVEVPKERQFIGFEAYKQAMECLRPRDVVILTTPPAFRWVHFTYAIQKGLNVFMEKPVTVDGPASRKMFKLGEDAKKANLKVGVGLMCRHCDARAELLKRIQDGQMGEITLLRAYRQKGNEATCRSGPVPKGMNELEYQIRRFHSFLWASGGCYSDFLIHNIDECCWMKGAWPVMAQAAGGRHYRGDNIDQNFDHYSVEYTFADGTKLLLEGRTMDNCYQRFASFASGTKGSAIISNNSHTPAQCKIFKGQNIENLKDVVWAAPQPEPDPYQLEWEHLMAAIRKDKPYNEVERGVEASLVTSMGRMAAHTGQLITRDQILNCDHEFAPNADRLVLGGEAPLKMNEEGKYPIPTPGKRIKHGEGRPGWYEF